MSIKNRLTALEVAQSNRPPVEQPKTEKELAMECAWGWQGLFDQLRSANGSLAHFIGGPTEIYVDGHSREKWPEFVVVELSRCAWACGQKHLRLTADELKLVREDLESFTVEEVDEFISRSRQRADLLDENGIPDMSVKGRGVPVVAGRTWFDKLAWALALGDRLDAELRKVNYQDCIASERERYMTFSNPHLYESPLETVPPLPDWVLISIGENEHPCEPYVFANGSTRECV